MGYQLKITIKNSHPPIWRRIIVPDRITFFDLDDIIEKAFGWTHDHMFAFDFKYPVAEFVGSPMHDEEDTADECIDEWMDEGRSFLYTYDFGDNWEHVIKVEKIVSYDKRYPQVLKYKGPNMIEDCGGIWGFYENKDEAVPFDMEKVNADFQKWNLPEVMETSLSGRESETIQWLKNHLLETKFMKNAFLHASEDELNLFESAIEEHGICMTEELLENNLLLMTYGGFRAEQEFYQVPQDVQDKYKKICTPEFREECRKNQLFRDYCDAALYLYGVLPVEKFVEIYNIYEGENLNVPEAVEQIEIYIQGREPYVLKEGLFMDADLEEEDLFSNLLRNQEKYSYYIPKDRDEFLAYGKNECQEPDEKVQFFINYLRKKLHKKAPEDLLIFLYIQEGIRMNASTEELIATLVECDCKISSQKQIDEAMKNLWKLGSYIRKWDYRGHTYAEVQKNEKVIAFPGTKKVYPNDPCPCGSGKKYKNYCGKK